MTEASEGKIDAPGRYQRRRSRVVETLMARNPDRERVVLDNGGQVEVFSHWVDIGPELKKGKGDHKYYLDVYVSGLFQTDKANTGNMPEARLVGGMVRPETDAVMVLKAEGLNKQAYEEDENGGGEGRVAAAAVEVLRRKMEGKPELHGREVVIRVTGYSEGSTQGASIAADLAEAGYGVREYISIGGAGMVGAPSMGEVDFVKFGWGVTQSRVKAGPSPKAFVDEGNGNYFIRGDMVAGWNKALGMDPAEFNPTLKDDAENVVRWALRLGRDVPVQRVRAACTLNPDYRKLGEMGVPVIVVSSTHEQLFSNSAVKDQAEKLRQMGGRVAVVTTDAGHEGPHFNPNAVAYMAQLISEKVEKKWINI